MRPTSMLIEFPHLFVWQSYCIFFFLEVKGSCHTCFQSKISLCSLGHISSGTRKKINVPYSPLEEFHCRVSTVLWDPIIRGSASIFLWHPVERAFPSFLAKYSGKDWVAAQRIKPMGSSAQLVLLKRQGLYFLKLLTLLASHWTT